MPHDLQDPQRVLTKSPRLGLFSPEAFAITDENVLLMLGDADNNEGLPPNSCSARVLRAIKAMVKSVNDNTIVFFAKNADMVTLNKVSLRYWELFAKNAGLLQDCVYWTQAIVYIRDNEQCSRICVVHFVDDREAVQSIAAKQEASKKAPSDAAAAADSAGEPSAAQAAQAPIGICAPQMDQDPQSAIQLLARELPPMPAEAWLLMDNVALIDTVYPQFQIDCIVVRGSCFSPPAILWLASESIICIEFCMCSPFLPASLPLQSTFTSNPTIASWRCPIRVLATGSDLWGAYASSRSPTRTTSATATSRALVLCFPASLKTSSPTKLPAKMTKSRSCRGVRLAPLRLDRHRACPHPGGGWWQVLPLQYAILRARLPSTLSSTWWLKVPKGRLGFFQPQRQLRLSSTCKRQQSTLMPRCRASLLPLTRSLLPCQWLTVRPPCRQRTSSVHASALSPAVGSVASKSRL